MAGDDDSDLEDMLNLHDAGVSVYWQAGTSMQEARRRTTERRQTQLPRPSTAQTQHRKRHFIGGAELGHIARAPL